MAFRRKFKRRIYRRKGRPYRRIGRRRMYRRTTYRRKRYSRMMRRGVSRVGNERMNQLRVMANPFSVATANPKIPDGKCPMSLGHKFQLVGEFTMSNTAGFRTSIFLFPGLACGVYIHNSAVVPAMQDGARVGRVGCPFYFGNHGHYITGALGTGGVIEMLQTPPGAGLAAWRIVSQGLKLSLVNNTEENDGWWEACRLKVKRDSPNFLIRLVANTIEGEIPNNTAAGSMCTLIPNAAQINAMGDVFGINTNTLVELPSYRTGKLRDLHKTAFILKPETNKHDLVRLRKTYPFFSNNQETYWHAHHTTDPIVMDFTDPTYDCIFIKLHGRTSEGAGATPSRILYHLATNQECIYDQDNTLARFHTKSY